MNLKEEWGFFRHVRELITQLLTVSGMMLAASVLTTVRVLLHGPEWAGWMAIIWNAMQVFNFTGRWIIPQFLQQWFATKANGAAPSTLTMTAKEGSVSASVTPTDKP